MNVSSFEVPGRIKELVENELVVVPVFHTLSV
jgi:hypothetical protein